MLTVKPEFAASRPRPARPWAVLFILCAFSCEPPAARAQENGNARRLERAAALIGGNQLAEAEQQLGQVLAAAPNEAAALNLLGAVRAKQGRLDEAEALFTRAVRADRRLAGPHMNLAYLYLLKRQPEKTALELREVLRLDPGNEDAAQKLAWVLLTEGRLDECIGFIEQSKRERPPSPALLSLLGEAYLKKGDAARAEESYLAALGEQRENPEALVGLALALQSRGDARAAASYLGRAKNLVGSSPALLYKFAQAALVSGLDDDAVAALRRAAALRPDEPFYHFALGAALFRLKQPDLQEAEQSFRQFLKLQPGAAQGQLYLGYALLKQKKYPEAREWLEKSVRTDTRTPENFYYLGLIAQEQNESERAVEYFGKAIALAPSYAGAHTALGSAHLKLKNYPLARQSLETGVRLNPDDTKAHYNLALLYARLKDTERAREEMRVVERLKSAGKALEDEGEALAPPQP